MGMGRESTGKETHASRRGQRESRESAAGSQGTGGGNGRDESWRTRRPGGDAAARGARLSDAEAKAGAELLRALADPARLQILDVLGHGDGEVSVHELEDVVGLPDPRTGRRPRQPTISHHLKILRAAGLVGFRRRGPWVHYYVRGERVAAARALLDTLA